MKKFYSQPEVEIKKYSFTEGVLTTPSHPETDNPDLEGGDDHDYNYFG